MGRDCTFLVSTDDMIDDVFLLTLNGLLQP